MLRIYRYLAMASAIALLLALVVVAWFYHQQAVRDLVEMTARHNAVVGRLLMNTIWTRYEDYLAAAGQMDNRTLNARPETAEIGEVIKELTTSEHILRIKIYGKDGLTIFSTNPAQIGQDYSISAAFQAAVREGRQSSELTDSDELSAFSGEAFKRDIVETYLPRFDEGRGISGVFEIYTDVTDVKEQIERTTVQILAGLVAIFGILYAVLVFGIMRRAIEPVRLASNRAVEIGPQSSGARLPTEGMPREILPLIVAMNGALDRLDRALDAQRRFAADSAHELLTPLAVLRAHLDTLKDKSVAAALHHDVDAMTDVVHQLLDLAELESHGGVTREAETADIHGVAIEVVIMLAPVAVRNKKQLALTGAEGPLLVRGSERLLNRALRNLIENALAHTPPDTTVEIRLGEDGSIRVTDKGEGVPPEERDAIFQRFWRGDKKTGPGAGLGLSIVKRIVESMGGDVRVEDAPGGGASFAIRLALVERAPNGTAVAKNRPSS